MPGKVLLFHVLRQSTIGAEGLDFRVRNGIGYYTFAKIARLKPYKQKKNFVNQFLRINKKPKLMFFNDFINIARQ